MPRKKMRRYALASGIISSGRDIARSETFVNARPSTMITTPESSEKARAVCTLFETAL